MRKDRSKLMAALQAATQQLKVAEQKGAGWQHEKTELLRQLEQTEEEAAANERALEAERAEFAEFKMLNGQGEDLLSHLRETARVNKEGWERERERFSNYKSRTERQRKEAHQQGRLDTLKALLSTIDDLERATEKLPQDIRDNGWGEGVELIHRNLVSMLKRYNVEAISPASGDMFDANFHESTVAEDNHEYESDRVIETIQKGYRLGDKLLRAALVKVSR